MTTGASIIATFLIMGILGIVNSRAAYRNGVSDGFNAALRPGDELYRRVVKPIIDRSEPMLWFQAVARSRAKDKT